MVKSICCSSRGPEFGAQHPRLVSHNYVELQHMGCLWPPQVPAFLSTHRRAHTYTYLEDFPNALRKPFLKLA